MNDTNIAGWTNPLTGEWVQQERLYVAGPMRGIPYFNFPEFHRVTKLLRARGHIVFSPAERDIQRCGGDPSNPTGDAEQAEREHGLTIRECLADDLAWICANATGLVLLKGWASSRGARAEMFTAQAIGIPTYTVHGALGL